ncbi:PREDICTED: neuronal regeneration-related protein [Crocodylus porosus]|uniref:neuronal regeneration-related protein n=1 Tax=Crocodylus porosus TaxID=8502 RepID=UPI00093A6401|nr:PREDICTED: neuronal regeneration-related protein [Crocodylus porosus]
MLTESEQGAGAFVCKYLQRGATDLCCLLCLSLCFFPFLSCPQLDSAAADSLASWLHISSRLSPRRWEGFLSLCYLSETAVSRLNSLKMVYQRRLTVWVNQNLFPTSQGDGGFPKGYLLIPKEVNRKKNKETEALFLIPPNDYGHHFTKINYLYSF